MAAAAERRRIQRGVSAQRRSGPERLPRPQPRGSQPAEVRPSSKARPIYICCANQSKSEAKRSPPYSTAIPSTDIQIQHSYPKHSTAIRSTAQRYEAQHSGKTHARGGYGRSSTARPEGGVKHSENGPFTLVLWGGLRTARPSSDPRPTLGFRAIRTACSSPRPIAPRSARNSGQEGRAAAVGLLRCSWHCASSRTASALRTRLAC
jgi:hypothetical protein